MWDKQDEVNTKFFTTFMYAKCKDHIRRPLGDRILYHAAENNKPWSAVGDFNVITSIDEKIRRSSL